MRELVACLQITYFYPTIFDCFLIGVLIMSVTSYIHESQEQSAEYLRLSFAMLGEFKLKPNPINFTICYEYISSQNQELAEALDELKKEKGSCTDNDANELFQQYIWDDDKRAVSKLRTDLVNVIMKVFHSVGDLQSDASSSVENLEVHLKALQAGSSINEMEDILDKVVSETRNMTESGHSLKLVLDQTRVEVDKLRNELESAKQEALTDPLTGLKNRRSFEVAIIDLMSVGDKADAEFCLLMVDIDHFKNVNDQYGHLFGDKVLMSVAKILEANVKGKDTVSRFGGEEFAVLLPDTKVEFAQRVAENLRKSVENSRIRKVTTGEVIDNVTISIGVSSFRKEDTLETFVNRADLALYVSKDRGRNRVSIEMM